MSFTPRKIAATFAAAVAVVGITFTGATATYDYVPTTATCAEMSDLNLSAYYAAQYAAYCH